MRRDSDRRTLAASFALAGALLLLLGLLVPQAWVQRWLRPYSVRDGGRRAAAPLVILPAPPLAAEVAPAAADSAASAGPSAETVPAGDPAWWRAAWRDWTGDRARDLRVRPPAPSRDLDLLAARLLSVVPDSLWRRAGVDTSRTARLAAVRAFYGADLRRALPDLRGAMAAREATAILNREAELFGEYLLVR